jgi:hypothetical protein
MKILIFLIHSWVFLGRFYGAPSPKTPTPRLIKKTLFQRKTITFYEKNQKKIQQGALICGGLWVFNGLMNLTDGSYELPEDIHKIKNLLIPFEYQGQPPLIKPSSCDDQYWIKKNNHLKFEIIMAQMMGCNKENTQIITEIQKKMKESEKEIKYDGPILKVDKDYYDGFLTFYEKTKAIFLRHLMATTKKSQEDLMKAKFFYKSYKNSTVTSIGLEQLMILKKDDTKKTIEINNVQFFFILVGNYLMKQEDVFIGTILDTIGQTFQNNGTEASYYGETATENYSQLGFWISTKKTLKKIFFSFFSFRLSNRF